MSGSYITGTNRAQTLLMPEIVDDYISKDNPARLFDSFVDSIDLVKLGFRHSCIEEGPGRPAYDPAGPPMTRQAC